MQEKCKHYTDKDVRDPIEYVCTKEIISERTKPKYDDIIKKFNDAITKVKKKTGQFEFEWLKHGSSSISTCSDATTTPSIIIQQATRTIPILSTRAQPPPFGRPVIRKKSSLKEKVENQIFQKKLDFQLGLMKSMDRLKKIKLDTSKY